MTPRRLLDSLRILLGRRRFESELSAELESHIAHQTDALIATGLPEAEARRRARAMFGSLDGARDEARAARGIRWADELAQDLRYGLRTLRRSPGYAAVAVATLALGIGANTAIFSVVDGVLLKPLPFPGSDRLVHVNFGYPLGAIWTYREQARAYSSVASYEYLGELNLFHKGIAERIPGRSVTSEFFSTLGVTPLRGRTFLPGEDEPGAAPVAVIGENLWRRRFDADPAIVGQSILIDGTPREVVGIVPRSFGFPSAGTDLWVPSTLDPKLVASVWGSGGVTMIGRLRPGVTLAQADAEHRALIPTVRRAPPFKLPDRWGTGAENHVQWLDAEIGGRVRGRLTLLLAAVGLVLLVACVNVVSLNLTRLTARERELAVRQALGGSRWRVARQLVVEQLVLAALGGGLGILTAYAMLPALLRRLPADTPRLAEVGIDPRVLLYAGGVVVLAGLLGSVGALGIRRAGGLADRGTSVGVRHHRLLNGLVGSEVALSVILALGAVILVRSLTRILAVDPGLVVERLITARVTPNPVACDKDPGPCTCEKQGRLASGAPQDQGRCTGFFPVLKDRLAAEPGVLGVALATTVPLDGGFFSFPMAIEDHPVPPGQPAFMLGSHTVSPGYFRTLGIPLIEGREFSAADRQGSPDVAIVSRSLQQRFWPGESPLGKRIKPVWFTHWTTVVGVVGDARYEGLQAPEQSQDFYLPIGQFGIARATVAIRSRLPLDQVERMIRRDVAAVDPSATVNKVRTMEEVLGQSVAQPRTTAELIGGFAGLALLLGAIGVYGVLSYGVSQRRREIGIRMAIGAEPGAVRRMVLTRAMGLVAGGILVGLGLAWISSSVLEGFVFGISARDPLSYALVPAGFVIVGLLAGWLPARRATRVSPVEVMREE